MIAGRQGQPEGHALDTATGRHLKAPLALDHLQAAIYTWNVETDVLQWSPNASRVFGLPADKLPATGYALAAMTEPGCGPTVTDAVKADATVSHPRGMPYRLQYGLRIDHGRVVMVEDNGRWFVDNNGSPAMAHGTLSVTSPADDQLLPLQTRSRSAFLSAIAQHASSPARWQNTTVLAFAVDFPDGTSRAGGRGMFASIHSHPHSAEILDELIRRTRLLMRRHDRLLLQPDGTIALALMACAESEVGNAMERLRATIEDEPITTSDGDIPVLVRVGASGPAGNDTTAVLLINQAEDALRQAAQTGQRFVQFDPINLVHRRMEKALVSFLRATELLSERSLDADLALSRRPLFDVHSRLPALHLVSPGRRTAECQIEAADYLRPVAEEAELSLRLDRHMLALTCAELAVSKISNSILPICAATLSDSAWPIVLAGSLGAWPGIASNLIIGIPEAVAASDFALLERSMNVMKALGIGVALTDFGAGRMDCETLASLPIDLLMLDGALIQNIATATENRFYVRSLIEAAKHLDIATAAMWVEDERTAQLLADWGVCYVEGRVRTAPAETEQDARRIA